jgi:predicted MPP superfamily phosphohydrolase
VPVSSFASRYLADLIALCIVALVQTAVAQAILRGPQARASRNLQYGIKAAWAASLVVLALGFLLRFGRVARFFPEWAAGWGRGTAMLWAFLSLMMAAAYAVGRGLTFAAARSRAGHSPARRRFLGALRWALLGAPAVATGYGTFVQRFRLSVREQNIPIPGLPHDLDGLRVAQLTDIHLSPFLSVRELERAVEMANETRPHLALVTGDLITTGNDPLDECLLALARLRADAGVFGCMGNHEIYAETEEYTQVEGARLGLRFLRQQSELLRFGSTDLNLAGVDYQHFNHPYLVGAEALTVPGAFNVLLSHNPDVFPVAAAKGFPLTIAGHTHGGQVRFEILRQDLNVARFFTRYVDGLYRIKEGEKDGSAIFVSRGIGTIALPTRLGAPPEVALLKLCRT